TGRGCQTAYSYESLLDAALGGGRQRAQASPILCSSLKRFDNCRQAPSRIRPRAIHYGGHAPGEASSTAALCATSNKSTVGRILRAMKLGSGRCRRTPRGSFKKFDGARVEFTGGEAQGGQRQ